VVKIKDHRTEWEEKALEQGILSAYKKCFAESFKNTYLDRHPDNICLH
jgi:hypothetical protein